jgi:hypothetical protein
MISSDRWALYGAKVSQWQCKYIVANHIAEIGLVRRWQAEQTFNGRV